MKLDFYSYANIVRILYVDEEDFSQSLMIDVDIDNEKILSIFDATKQFDSDFIKSFINILRVSTSGFRMITPETPSGSQNSKQSSSDNHSIDKAMKVVKMSTQDSAVKLSMIL